MVCSEGEKGPVSGIVKGSTIAAIATPIGRGGIGVIRISGPEALAIARRLSPGAAEIQARFASLRFWQDADASTLDAGLLLYFPAPHSYTGEDVIELQGHGGPVMLRALLARVFELGAIAAEPGEFTRRAVENGRMDLTQAEAVAASIDAATVRAGKLAQRQLQGSFGRQIEALMSSLTGVVAHVEACLDFSEEEIPELFLDRLADQVDLEVLSPMRSLLSGAKFGERIFDGASVAIIGAPNVGKSSLLNALAGHDRAIVSDIPGTTRDTLEVDFEVHGIPVRLTDTAGIRHSSDQIEQEGVRRAENAAAQADAVVFVADANRPDTWQSHQSADLLVFNKVDLVDVKGLPDEYLRLSVLTGEGVSELQNLLAAKLGDMAIGDEGVLVTRERHRRLIQNSLVAMEEGLSMLHSESSLDLVAMQWRRAWGELGKILGIGDVEHILDRVFADFCIGK